MYKSTITIVILFISAQLFGQNLVQYSIMVKGACAMCTERIEEAARATAGVKKGTYDLMEQSLTVEVEDEQFSVFELHQNIAQTGHTTSQKEASDEAYNELPECCKYEDVEIHGIEEEAILDGSSIIGKVYEKLEDGTMEPLIGANLTWLESGTGTSTEADGSFEMSIPESDRQLIVSYVGFSNDTLLIENAGELEIVMDPSVTLDAVNITYRRKATEVSYVNPLKIQQISSEELTKAACCTLSESFETTASVDIGFADAITGLRTIQMLGLAGPYVQITREGLPDVRGLAALYGMEFTPGPWIGEIQLNQGVGSVVQGFEGIAGQINVQLYEPFSKEKLYLNGYGNIGGRYEGNLSYNTDVSENVATAITAHVSQRKQAHDHNNDSFLDMPLSDQKILMNRWSFSFTDDWVGQVGVKLSQHEHSTGQSLRLSENQALESPWQSAAAIDRQEIWAKSGYTFNDSKSSLALQLSYSQHEHNSNFGSRRYDANQNTIFANAMLKHITEDDGDYIMFGLSYLQDDMSETLGRFNNSPYDFDFVERVPGIWAEYNFLKGEKFTLVAGARADYHNKYGFFATPRLHLRYAPTETTVMRLVAGRGQKTAKVIAENLGMLASNREVIINGADADNPYGLEPEVAWNFGANLVQDFSLGDTEVSLQLDGYYTLFENQVVIDNYNSGRSVQMYNLDGDSRSISLQALASISPAKNLEIRVAHRFNEVKTQYIDGFLHKPLIAPHRTFVNVGYEHSSGWQIDYTVNRIGQKYIGTLNNKDFEGLEQSPVFYMHNTQISKVWDDKFELYLGIENIFDYHQHRPIQRSYNTENPYFDASQVWGPIFGRNVYMGFRHKLFNDSDRKRKGCG